MYCVKCGVKLADTEKKCPLCQTVVYHPEVAQEEAEPLYPKGAMPKVTSGRKALSGAVIILFLIPLVISFFSDMQMDGTLQWFGYVAGALVFAYVAVALPLWFRKPNPVIFVPCDFAAAGVLLWYIHWRSGGNWFWCFALPILAGLALIVCTVVTLERYVKGGKLYLYGGALIALGALLLCTEWLLSVTFQLSFVGWSVYPLIVTVLLGLLLIYLAINPVARETLERKLFF